MFYDKSYVLSDYLNYDDLNELIDKEKELINEVAYQEVGDTENVIVNGKEYETGSDYFLEGNAIQNGTPTPTSPIEIRDISGSQNITVSDRNIFDYTKDVLYSNAVNTTIIENGIRASVRTAGAYRYIVLDIGKTIDLVGKTIRVKCNFSPSSTNVSGYSLIYCDSAGGNRNTTSSATTSGQTISATVETTKTNIALNLYTNMNSTSQPVGTYTDFTNIMITVDDSDMTYEEFKGQSYVLNLGNIELCKIGNYKDRIYKENGKWYLHNEIGKIVLNGSEDGWSITGTNPFYRFRYLYDALYTSSTPQPILCNYFGYSFINSTSENIGLSISSTKELRIRETTMKTIDDWKSWLSTHNITVYYALEITTTTEITDTELISELEEISSKIKYWNYEIIFPIENYDLDLPVYELNDFVYLEDINKIEKNIMQLSYDFYQPPGYIKNKTWRTEEDLDVYKSFSYEDINRMITDMNILYEHRLDTPTIYNLYTNENWDGETTLEWE